MIKNSYSQLNQDIFVDQILRQDEGYFIEAGCGDGYTFSNTLSLEEAGWTGLLIDIDRDLLEKCLRLRNKNSIVLELDLLKVSLSHVLNEIETPQTIDYLSVDIDDCSLAVLAGFPFDEYDIKVITFEHDSYRFGSQLKTPSRKLLKEKGFALICEDVGLMLEENCFAPQEDWYVNTNLVAKEKWVGITPQLINEHGRKIDARHKQKVNSGL